MPTDTQPRGDLPAPGQDAFHQLTFYTLAHGDRAFIHQHVVDAFAAQHAEEDTKPIAVVFGLIGLYLYLEKGFTGRQVQQMHMRLARFHKPWPKLPLPPAGARGDITEADVLAAAPGPDRDQKTHQWCESVWQAWRPCRPQIVAPGAARTRN